MLNLLLALVLGAVALALLAYVVALLFGAVSGPLGAALERRRFAAHVARAERIDALMREGRVDEALPLFLGCFYLSNVGSPGLAGAVANHHTGLLSRLIALTSEEQGGSVRLLSLAKADRLLAERGALQKRYTAAAQSGSLERRRELRRHLETNRRELRAAVSKLVEEVRATRQEKARYH